MKEKELSDNKEVISIPKKDQSKKEIKNDEFEEVVSIITGKVKRMRFAKEIGLKNKN